MNIKNQAKKSNIAHVNCLLLNGNVWWTKMAAASFNWRNAHIVTLCNPGYVILEISGYGPLCQPNSQTGQSRHQCW